MYIAILLFAVSMSIDALGVGTTYGLKNIKISFLPKCLMSVLSFLYSAAAMRLGGFLAEFLPKQAGAFASGLMLGAIGIYTLCGAVRSCREKTEDTPHMAPPSGGARVLHRFIKPLGISVTIIKHPTAADFDGSRSIDWRESLYVGLALSFDAIGAGIGYSLNGEMCYLLPVLIGGFQFLFLSLGCAFGEKIKQNSRLNQKILAFLPGLIMLGLAITRFL